MKPAYEVLGSVAIHLPGDSGCRIEVRNVSILGLDESGLIEHALQILRDISSIPMSELRVQVIDVCHPALSSPDNKTWSFPEWPAQNKISASEDASTVDANVGEAQAKAAERSALVLKQFGDGLPFDLPRYEHVIRTHLVRSADEMLAAGRALLVVREHIHHGEWNEFLDRLSIDRTLAKRMQQAALKFSNGATSHHLLEAAGNKSKLIELLVLDDDQVAELNEGGTVAGITLDDVATMSVSDLRKTLREARAEAEANDKLLSEKTTRSTRSRRA